MSPGVVVTRDERGDGPLTRLLRARGFAVLHWPVIRIAPPDDPGPLDAALTDLARFDWIVFTSPRSVAAVGARVAAADGPNRPRVAAVGASTAEALRDAGWDVEVVPPTQTGEALVSALRAGGLRPGDRVLFPASAIARDTVPDGLEEAGAVVVQVEAYRTVAAPLDVSDCLAAVRRGEVEVVTFTSPSTVENLMTALGSGAAATVRSSVGAAAIGPTTGAAARQAGFDVVVAEPHSLEGLADRVATLVADERIEEA